MRLLLIAILIALSASLASAASLMYVPGVVNPIGPRLSLIWNFKGSGGGGGGGGGCASVCLVLRII